MSGDSKNVNILYEEYENNLWLERFRVILVIAAIFIPLFGILDYLMYKQHLKEMLIIRFVFTALTIATLFICVYVKKHINFLTYIATTAFYICINLLVFVSEEGASSPYYAGLNLATIATAAIIPWNAGAVVIMLIEKVILYLITIKSFAVLNNQKIDIALLSNNLFFMVSTGCFCIAAKYLESKMKYKEFYLRLYKSNQELESTFVKLKTTQGQLIHSEKLNAIGNLSAGLLHEINNPLNYSSMAVEMIKEDEIVKNNPRLQDYVNDIKDGVDRVIRIVSDLRSFAYPNKDNKNDKFRVADAVEKARRFTASEMRDIKISVDILDNLEIKGSENHIIQVLVNLITNACKAINKKNAGNGEIVISTQKNENNVIIVVSDNGIGMSPEIANKIFEPFYTTRDVGEGLGLGLSICYTILKNHDATIAVKSEENKGAQFILTFHNYEK